MCSILTEDEKLSLLLQENSNGSTPLAIACSSGVLSIIEALLSNVNLRGSSFQWSVLDEAYKNAHISIIMYFCTLCEKDVDGSTALHHACSLGNVKVAFYISIYGYGDPFIKNNAGLTSLECACINGHLSIIKYFDKFLANNNFDKISSHLILACKHGHTDIMKYLIEEKCMLEAAQIDEIFILKNILIYLPI